MSDASQESALRADRGKLRVALADLKRLKQRRRPPPAAGPPLAEPAAPLFKFVPTSFIESIDWDAADNAPGPEGASQFNWQLAAPAPAPSREELRTPPVRPAPAEPEYEGVMERADFFLKEFDWQDEADGTQPEPSSSSAAAPVGDPMTDSRAFGDSFGWEEPASQVEAAAPPAPPAPPAADPEDAAPPTTDSVFTSFQWD